MGERTHIADEGNTIVSRGLGRLQAMILDHLIATRDRSDYPLHDEHGPGWHVADNLIADLLASGVEGSAAWNWNPTRSQYVSFMRALSGLLRRGLVEKKLISMKTLGKPIGRPRKTNLREPTAGRSSYLRRWLIIRSKR